MRLLVPGERLAPSLFAPNLKAALASYIPALLETRYPHHPDFRVKLTNKSAVESVLRWFDLLCDQPDHRLADLKRDELDTLRGSLGALGIVRLSESAAHLVTDGPLQRIERRREQEAVDNPNVDEIHRWFNEGFRFGLQAEPLAILVRCYARLYARTLVSGGRPWSGSNTAPIPGLVVLEKPELPRDDPWSRAHKLASAAFGLRVRTSNTADNLQAFEAALTTKLTELGRVTATLPDALAGWLAALGLPDDGPRLTTAQSARDLVRALQGRRALQQVEALAGFNPQTSAQAIGSSLATAARAVEQLGSALLRGTFEQLRLRQDQLPLARAILDELADLLQQDEHNRPLGQHLQQLADRATSLNLQAAQSAPVRADARTTTSGPLDPIHQPGPHDTTSAETSAEPPRDWDVVTANAEELEALLDELRSAAQQTTGPVRWQVRLHRRTF